MRLRDLGSAELAGIALLVTTASIAAAAGAPAAVRAPLILAAIAAVAAAAAITRRRGWADAVLAGTGGVLVVLVVAGLLLGASPAGLRPLTWAITLALSGLGVIVAASGRRHQQNQEPAPQAGGDPQAGGQRSLGRIAGRPLVWTVWTVCAVAGMSLVAAAFTVSIRATDASERPPIQMWLAASGANSVQVVVRSSGPTGPLELRAQTSAGAALSYPVVRVPAGGAVTTVVAVPRTGRVQITLNNVNQSAPLRSLILDRSSS